MKARTKHVSTTCTRKYGDKTVTNRLDSEGAPTREITRERERKRNREISERERVGAIKNIACNPYRECIWDSKILSTRETCAVNKTLWDYIFH